MRSATAAILSVNRKSVKQIISLSGVHPGDALLPVRPGINFAVSVQRSCHPNMEEASIRLDRNSSGQLQLAFIGTNHCGHRAYIACHCRFSIMHFPDVSSLDIETSTLDSVSAISLMFVGGLSGEHILGGQLPEIRASSGQLQILAFFAFGFLHQRSEGCRRLSFGNRNR